MNKWKPTIQKGPSDDLCQELERCEDRLTEVEQERDGLKQQLMTVAGRLLEVGKERDEWIEKYRIESIDCSYAQYDFFELRELVKWYLECNDFYVNYQMNSVADMELLNTAKHAGAALREAVKEG